MSAQEHMRQEYVFKNPVPFKNKLKIALEEGILIFSKWALIVILSFVALQYLTGIISGSQNGTNAVIYLTELQNKGYLPKVVNGAVPAKENGNAKP